MAPVTVAPWHGEVKEGGERVRNNNNAPSRARAVRNNLPIARVGLLIQQNRRLTRRGIRGERARGKEKARARKREREKGKGKRPFHLANFINFAISWRRSSNGPERRERSVYSLV